LVPYVPGTRSPGSNRDEPGLLRTAALVVALTTSAACSGGPTERRPPATDSQPAATVQAAGTSRSREEPVAGATDAYAPSRVAAELDRLLGDVPGPIRYFAKQVDLDADGRPELIVHVAGPMVCGTGGCNTIVLTQDGEGLREVATITVTRPPIVVAATSSNGWRDLLVAVSGGGMPAQMARLRFDGSSYPANPTVEPAEALQQHVDGETVVAEFESFTDGVLLRPAPE
jgi:hypothetical protein